MEATDYNSEWIDLLLFGGKVCVICDFEKPRCRTYFTTDKRNDDGLKSQCKTCRAAAVRQCATRPTRWPERSV
jgi:hypothetical protein